MTKEAIRLTLVTRRYGKTSIGCCVNRKAGHDRAQLRQSLKLWRWELDAGRGLHGHILT
jgi:hypothetical protein